jgi:hypothetical protein
MTDVEKLLAIEEIKRLMATRLRVMDLKQWDEYGALHTEDAVSETYGDLPPDKQPVAGGARNRVVGPAALTAAIRRFMEHPTPITSSHHVHQPEIRFTSETTATGLWPMEDHLWWRNGDAEEHLHGYGHYYEEYRKVDGRWLISFRRLTRLRLDKTPRFHDRIG